MSSARREDIEAECGKPCAMLPMYLGMNLPGVRYPDPNILLTCRVELVLCWHEDTFDRKSALE
jgi:hypothetical protein